MKLDDAIPSFDVEVEITLLGKKSKARGKLCLCPFCMNRDEDRISCLLCDATGILIKLKQPHGSLDILKVQGGLN